MTDPVGHAGRMRTLHLVRHGERGDGAGLSERGHTQARLLGARLAELGIDTVHHSPLPRAVETAHSLGLVGVPVLLSELLSDRTPVPLPDEERDYPAEHLASLAGVRPPERDLGARQLRAAVEHFETGPDRNEVLVTHAFVVGWFTRHALDAPDWRWIGLHPAHASLTSITLVRGRPPTLLRFNDVGHLPVEMRT